MTNNDKYIVTTDNTVNAFSSLQEAVEYLAKGLSYNYDQRDKAKGIRNLCRLEYDIKINEKLVDKVIPPGVS
jgi:hypothetical protein